MDRGLGGVGGAVGAAAMAGHHVAQVVLGILVRQGGKGDELAGSLEQAGGQIGRMISCIADGVARKSMIESRLLTSRNPSCN